MSTRRMFWIGVAILVMALIFGGYFLLAAYTPTWVAVAYSLAVALIAYLVKRKYGNRSHTEER